MRTDISALHQRLKTTMIYVTHDQVEAMTMTDKIVVLRAARVEQVGAPLDLYNTPRNQFMAGFIGSPRASFLSARVTGVDANGTRVAADASRDGTVTIPVHGESGLVGQHVTLGIRPEHIPVPSAEAGELALDATIELLEQLGATTFLYSTLPSGEKLTVHLAGERVEVCFSTRGAHLFTKSEGERALECLAPLPAHLAA